MRITTATGTRSYTYQTSDELEEGYKINIEGTYTEAVGVTLSGTIEGTEWKGERTIRFDFDESGTVKQMRMLNANVSNPNNNAAYIRPVVTISISKESPAENRPVESLLSEMRDIPHGCMLC